MILREEQIEPSSCLCPWESMPSVSIDWSYLFFKNWKRVISLHINSELTTAVSNIIKTFTCLTILRIFSSVRSTSVLHGLKEIQQQQATFLNFSNLEQSCLYTFINSLSLSFSVQYTEQNQAIILPKEWPVLLRKSIVSTYLAPWLLIFEVGFFI